MYAAHVIHCHFLIKINYKTFIFERIKSNNVMELGYLSCFKFNFLTYSEMILSYIMEDF